MRDISIYEKGVSCWTKILIEFSATVKKAAVSTENRITELTGGKRFWLALLVFRLDYNG
jgi:hypothetical protein